MSDGAIPQGGDGTTLAVGTVFAVFLAAALYEVVRAPGPIDSIEGIIGITSALVLLGALLYLTLRAVLTEAKAEIRFWASRRRRRAP